MRLLILESPCPNILANQPFGEFIMRKVLFPISTTDIRRPIYADRTQMAAKWVLSRRSPKNC